MADNSTDPILAMLKEFDIGNLILAFSLSMVVGLLLGSLVYVLLTWMSRRRASAQITRRPTRTSRSSAHSPLYSRPAFARNSSNTGERRSNSSLAGAAFSFQRQASLDLVDPLGRKSSFRASTFHPLLQCSQVARAAEDSGQAASPRTPVSDPTSFLAAPQGIQPTQTPPPAYNSVIRAFQETCT